jgi:hypothetical protein
LSVNFSNSTPAAVAGNTNVTWQTDGSGNISGYVPTSSSVTNKVDLTGQTAAVSATNLVASPATARYRIGAYLKVTTAGSVSSTLGGVTITYADGTDGVPQSVVMQMQTEAGASATTNTGNATTSVLAGELLIYAQTGTAIQYAIAYTANAAASMHYEAHLSAEQI